MKFNTRFDLPVSKPFDQTGEESLTRQSEADGCDINLIMERFNRTGKLPAMQSIPPKFGDSRVVDYMTAQNIVKEAKEQFEALPSNVRKAFGNDPANFLDAIADQSEENAQKLLKLGILVPRKESPEEMLLRIANNTKPAEKSAE